MTLLYLGSCFQKVSVFYICTFLEVFLWGAGDIAEFQLTEVLAFIKSEGMQRLRLEHCLTKMQITVFRASVRMCLLSTSICTLANIELLVYLHWRETSCVWTSVLLYGIKAYWRINFTWDKHIHQLLCTFKTKTIYMWMNTFLEKQLMKLRRQSRPTGTCSLALWISLFQDVTYLCPSWGIRPQSYTATEPCLVPSWASSHEQDVSNQNEIIHSFIQIHRLKRY